MRLVCTVDGCGDFRKGYGYCNKHLLRIKKHGSPDGKATHAPLEERFWRQVSKGAPGECWTWLGSKRPNGYGKIGAGGKGGKQLGAHRLSCEWAHGAPPFEGAQTLHSCDNRECVNPAHLRWGTGSENIREAVARNRMPQLMKPGCNIPGRRAPP